MFLKKFLSHSLIYAIGPQIPKLASFFILPILTKYLTSFDYGVQGILLSYLGVFSALNDLGLTIILVNAYFKYKTNWKIIWRQIHAVLSVWSIFYNVLVATFLWFVFPKEVIHHYWIVVFTALLPNAIFNTTIIFATRYYQFSQQPIFVAVVSAISGILNILFTLYFIAELKLGYLGWFISSGISVLFQFIAYFYPVYIKKKLFPVFLFRFKYFVGLLKISLPLIPHNYSSYLLSSSDRVVMDRLQVNVNDVGRYNIASIFAGYYDFVGIALGQAVGPFYTALLSEKSKSAEKKLFNLTHWLQLSFILGGFVLSVFSKELFGLLISNNDLKKQYPIAIILIMCNSYRPYYWNIMSRLQFSELTRNIWKISFFAGALNVVLNLILIPFFGIWAAVLTTYVCYLILGFGGYLLEDYRKWGLQNYYPLLILLLIIVVTVISFLLVDYNLFNKLIIVLLVIGAYSLYTVKTVAKLNF